MKTKQFSVEFSDEAEVDFDKQYEYYFEDNLKVADTFFQRISVSLEKIKQNPYSYPIVYRDIRKYVVKKFPFVIYYQIVDHVIRVIAVFHTSRNPEIWNDRV